MYAKVLPIKALHEEFKVLLAVEGRLDRGRVALRRRRPPRRRL